MYIYIYIEQPQVIAAEKLDTAVVQDLLMAGCRFIVDDLIHLVKMVTVE